MRYIASSWLVLLDHSRVDKVVIGYDARPDDGSHDEVKHPLRDRIDLAGRKEPLVAPTALAQLLAVDVTLAEVELVAEVRPVDGARLVAAAVALLAHLHDPLLDLLAIRAVEQCLRLHRLRDPPPRLLRVESWRRWIVEADPEVVAASRSSATIIATAASTAATMIISVPTILVLVVLIVVRVAMVISAAASTSTAVVVVVVATSTATTAAVYPPTASIVVGAPVVVVSSTLVIVTMVPTPLVVRVHSAMAPVIPVVPAVVMVISVVVTPGSPLSIPAPAAATAARARPAPAVTPIVGVAALGPATGPGSTAAPATGP